MADKESASFHSVLGPRRNRLPFTEFDTTDMIEILLISRIVPLDQQHLVKIGSGLVIALQVEPEGAVLLKSGRAQRCEIVQRRIFQGRTCLFHLFGSRDVAADLVQSSLQRRSFVCTQFAVLLRP